MFKYATVCSGVEGASLALQGMDWEPVFFSEIDPFPSAVLQHHFSHVPNLGDITQITYDASKGIVTNGTTSITIDGRLDCLCGGTPCQDLSIAGLRKGSDPTSGTRSSLLWHFVRLVQELRPRTFLWENVVGTLSSNGGRDFSSFVATLNECGYSVSWRVLDCQYTRLDKWPMAIPQRRKRLWLVGCPSTAERGIEEVLFERPSFAWNPCPSREEKKEPSTTPKECDQSYAGVLEERTIKGQPVAGTIVAGIHKQVGTTQDGLTVVSFDCTPTLRANMGDNQTANATEVIALDGDKLKPRTDARKGGNGFGINEEGVGYTLTATDRHGVAMTVTKQMGISDIDVAQTLIATDCKEPQMAIFSSHPNDSRITGPKESASTLTSRLGTGGNNSDLVCCYENHAQDSRVKELKNNVSPTLGTTASNNPITGNNPLVVEDATNYMLQVRGGVERDRYGKTAGKGALIKKEHVPCLGATHDAQLITEARNGENLNYVVRRLTPVECERLMGFPDNWTKIPYRGKPADQCPDSPRYKACGNGWAINCARWILQRIDRYLRKWEYKNDN